ncbi:hypothetical protein HDU98_002268 [Podochytrium sp. JEL0797]|nr:hypothetical protein HDU98_002268 [Podochytrium sp. JEL0797]
MVKAHNRERLASFIAFSSKFIGRSALSFNRCPKAWHESFIAHFGVSLLSCIDLWDQVHNAMTREKLEKTHFFWALHHLKAYPLGLVGAAKFNTRETNWRDKVRRTIKVFSEMDLIYFEDRTIDWDCIAPSCYVDGVDIIVREERPMNRALFSHKSNHAGHRFQVATAIGCSKIVHVSSGVPCGANPDLKMVRTSLLHMLEEGERVAADSGYRGDDRIITKLQGGTPEIRKHNRRMQEMGARHETVNKRFKDFGILGTGMYRGNVAQLTTIFQAVAQITQLKLEREPLYDIVDRLDM